MARPATATPLPATKLTRGVEITRTLVAHGFLDLARSIAKAVRDAPAGTEPVFPPDVPRRTRLLLEALGPTFIKVGQLLGTRPDLVPKAFVEEFRNLYDRTTPSPFPEVRTLLERELGRPLPAVFTDFEETPIASASVGQVHRARLRSGAVVAVKVQHPGIEERVRIDFELLRPILAFVERLFAGSRVWQPSHHLAELQGMLTLELDFRHEARNHARVHESFRDAKDVVIPRIHREASTTRVLTLEFIDGAKLSDPSDPRLAKVDGPAVARTITQTMAKQIFEDRLFHADPSPGNLLVVGERTVAFLDFGAVGRVTRRRSDRILRLLRGFTRSDTDAVVASLVDLCNVTGDLDTKAVGRDVERIMDHMEAERASIADPVVFDMVLGLARRHRMLLPPDFMLITRALFQFEGVCKRLDPDYDLTEALSSFAQRSVRDEVFDATRQKEALMDAALQYTELVRSFPARVNSILSKLEANELAVKVDVRGASDIRRAADRRVVAASLTAVVGAVLVGVALLLGTGRSEALPDFAFVGVLALAAWAMGMLAFWSED